MGNILRSTQLPNTTREGFRPAQENHYIHTTPHKDPAQPEMYSHVCPKQVSMSAREN